MPSDACMQPVSYPVLLSTDKVCGHAMHSVCSPCLPSQPFMVCQLCSQSKDGLVLQDSCSTCFAHSSQLRPMVPYVLGHVS